MGDDPSRGQADDARWSGWMRRAQQGDREAYASLLTELSDVIAAFLHARFGTSGFVEDCVQECLLSIHRGRGSYDPRRPFRPWLFAIVRRRAIDELRARSKRPTEPSRSESIPDTADLQLADPSRSIDGARLLETLPQRNREALVMTKYFGFSISEAARQAGVTDVAMKTRVHRAIRQIRRELASEDLVDFVAPPLEALQSPPGVRRVDP